jgi:LPS sulfotransferase NodH
MQTRDRHEGHHLVFLVGCPRSGTTWLQKLLASHPSVHTGQESNLFLTYLGPQLRAWRRELTNEFDPERASGRGGVGLPCYLREGEFVQILRDYAHALLASMVGNLANDEIFLEKTPSHALFIPEIKKLLPESRIIHIMRDPRDVVASLLAAQKTWGKGWAPDGAGRAALTWVKHVRAVKQAEKNLSDSEFYEVTYEQLSTDPVETLSSVFTFLRRELHRVDVETAVKANSFRAMKVDGGTPIQLDGEIEERTQQTTVEEPEGFLRKGQVGAWRTELSLWQKFRVWYVANSTMQTTGYDW